MSEITLDTEAELQSIDERIDRLQYRRFELTRKLEASPMTLVPYKRNYDVAARWRVSLEGGNLLVKGDCFMPDNREWHIAYSVSGPMLFSAIDRLALLEHLHRDVVSKISQVIEELEDE